MAREERNGGKHPRTDQLELQDHGGERYARARRLLGPLVRAVPRHRPDPRGGGEGIRWEGAGGQGQRGRQPGHRLPVRRAGDPHPDPLQERPDPGTVGRRQPEDQHRLHGAEEPLRRAPAPPLLLATLLLLAACGQKAVDVGSRPFPAARPVFVDASGKSLAALPESPEPVRLVLLDYPWCPACAETWKALRLASEQARPGSARVYRVLFDRETALRATGREEVPPLQPQPIPGAGGPEGFPVTVLTALPGPFGEEFRVSQAPVLLLLDRDGTVARRWVGYSPGMAAEVAGEVRNRSQAPSPPTPER